MFITALLGALPVVGNLVTSTQKTIFDSKVRIIQAKTGADREAVVEALKTAGLESEQRKETMAIVASSKILTVMVVAFAAPLIIFVWKVIVWDKVMGLGSTDALHGQVGDWANQIVWFIFGAPTALSGLRMFLSRKQ